MDKRSHLWSLILTLILTFLTLQLLFFLLKLTIAMRRADTVAAICCCWIMKTLTTSYLAMVAEKSVLETRKETMGLVT